MENKAKKDLRKIAVFATAGIGVVGVGAVSQGSVKAEVTTQAAQADTVESAKTAVSEAEKSQQSAADQAGAAQKAEEAAKSAAGQAQTAYDQASKQQAVAQKAADQAKAEQPAAEEDVSQAKLDYVQANNRADAASQQAESAKAAAVDQAAKAGQAEEAQKKAQDDLNKVGVSDAEAAAKAAADKKAQADEAEKSAADQVQKSEEDLTSAQEVEKAAEDEASAAETTADSASQKSQAAKTANDEAQAAKAEQEGNVNQAQNKVDQAQKVVDDLGLPKLAEDLENAKTADSAAQKNLTDAKSADQAAAENLEKANSDQAAKDQEAAGAQKAVDQVNGQVKKLTDADNEAKAASGAANNDLAAKKATESEAEQEYQALPKVVANDTLKQATLAFANAKKQYNNEEIDEATYQQAIKTWADAMAAGMNLNTYYGLDSDKNVKVDLNNLTQDQQEELNAYLVQLLNSARTALGTANLAGNVVGSVGANAAASEIAVGYRNDHWNSFVNHHDNAAVNSVAKKYGLAVPENSSGQLIENLHTLATEKFADQDHINMYDAKKSVYDGVIGMLFDDYKNGNKMGHAVSLLGLNVLNYDKTNSNLTT